MGLGLGLRLGISFLSIELAWSLRPLLHSLGWIAAFERCILILSTCTWKRNEYS